MWSDEEIMAAIAAKCEKGCGILRAWGDGKCRAGESCALYPYRSDKVRLPGEPTTYEDL